MKKVLLIAGICACALLASGQPGHTTAETIRKTDRGNGIFNSTDLNYAFGLGETTTDYSKYFYGLSTVTGYQFARIIKGGLGLGVLSFNGGMLFPAYAHLRFDFLDRGVKPFLYADGGYMFNFKDFSNESRPFVDAGAGVRIIIREGLSANLSGGLLRHYGGAEVKSTFVNLRAGIEFKAK